MTFILDDPSYIFNSEFSLTAYSRTSNHRVKMKIRKLKNDFVIKNTGQDSVRHRGQHVCIRYCPKINCFMVRDLGTGYGTFSRVDAPQILTSNSLISIGTSFLLIQLGQESQSRPSAAFADLTNFASNSSGSISSSSAIFAQII